MVETELERSSVPSLQRASSRQSQQAKPWQHPRRQSLTSLGSSRSQPRPDPDEIEHLAQHPSRTSTASERRTPRWWKVRLFRGMVHDVKRRAPYYWSDWRDAVDYRVVPATVYMYFANILPALAFSLDMFVKTDNSYGVNEVLLASVLGCVVFALFVCQPLVIVGVTGPITVFSYTVYDIVVPGGTDFFSFMAWIGIWSLVMHWILAITNACNALTYVTRFSCDIFGFYVAFIYLQKGIQVLTRQWEDPDPVTPYLSIMVSLLVMMFAYGCGIIGESRMFPRIVRNFIEDYGTPLTIVFFTGFVHIGYMKGVLLEPLPTSKAFFPTIDRSWFVSPGNLAVEEIFLAIPFALLLTILFYFDHNVSSLMAQGTEFPLRKPPGFHWDIFLLGITTFIAGILGIPFPNGLIPQAPFHTQSLVVTRNELDEKTGRMVRKPYHVVEQRVSNFAQGLLFLGTMTGPLLVVLHLIPQGVLAGLFFVMGLQALTGNGVTAKLLYLCRDPELHTPDDPLRKLDRQLSVWVFVAIELIGFGATFAITQTIAAIGFPIIVMALVPLRTFVMPLWFRPEELRALDAPTAGEFVMESVGGAFGYDSESTIPGADAFGNTSNSSQQDLDRDCAINDEMERGEAIEMTHKKDRSTSGFEDDSQRTMTRRRTSHASR